MNIKYVLQVIFFTLLVFLVIHLVTLGNISKEIIHVKEIPLITKRFTLLNERILKIEEDGCRESLTNMLNRVKNTYFSKDITLKEYYDAYNSDGKNFIDYYEEVNTSCELVENDDIYFLVLASLNYPNSIKNRYDLRYEYNIRDIFSRDELYKTSDELGTYTTKLLEFQVIDRLIEEVDS